MKTPLEKSRSKFDFDCLISNVLRYGVLVSTSIIAIGVLLSPLKIGSYGGCPSSLEEVCSTNFGRPVLALSELILGLSTLNPLSIIQLGVLILLAVPFFRVATSIIMYASKRNWTYVTIAGFVLFVLLLGTFVVAPLEAG